MIMRVVLLVVAATAGQSMARAACDCQVQVQGSPSAESCARAGLALALCEASCPEKATEICEGDLGAACPEICGREPPSGGDDDDGDAGSGCSCSVTVVGAPGAATCALLKEGYDDCLATCPGEAPAVCETLEGVCGAGACTAGGGNAGNSTGGGGRRVVECEGCEPLNLIQVFLSEGSDDRCERLQSAIDTRASCLESKCGKAQEFCDGLSIASSSCAAVKCNAKPVAGAAAAAKCETCGEDLGLEAVFRAGGVDVCNNVQAKLDARHACLASSCGADAAAAFCGGLAVASDRCYGFACGQRAADGSGFNEDAGALWLVTDPGTGEVTGPGDSKGAEDVPNEKAAASATSSSLAAATLLSALACSLVSATMAA